MIQLLALAILGVLTGRCLGASVYPQPLRSQVDRYQGPPVVPVILPGGFIADTEEVARAKEYHFSAFAQAASAVKDTRYNPAEEQRYTQPKYSQAAPVRQQLYSQTQQYTQQLQQPVRQQDYNVPQQRYTGPALSSYSEPKQSLDYQQSAYAPQQPQQRYQGPPVIPVILPNGYIADTADVEAAKEHHFQLFNQAQEAAARAQERDGKKYSYSAASRYTQPEDDGQYEEEQNYNQVYNQPSAAQAYQPTSAPAYSAPTRGLVAKRPYQGPPANTVVLPSGHIADTAEVAAAKISHLQQLLDAAQRAVPQQRYQAQR